MPTSPLRRPRARALRRLAGTCPARRRPRLCRASSYTCHGGSASTHLRSIRACYARGALAAAPRSQAGPRRARHLARRGLNSTIGRWSASALTTRRTLSRPARGGAVTQPRTLGTGAGCGRRQASVHHGLQCSEPRAHSLHARRMPLLPGLSQTPPLGSASGHACPTALAPACLPCKALRAGGALSSASKAGAGGGAGARALWGSGAARTTSSSSSATGSRSFTAPIWKATSACHWFFSMDATPMSGYSCARGAPPSRASWLWRGTAERFADPPLQFWQGAAGQVADPPWDSSPYCPTAASALANP